MHSEYRLSALDIRASDRYLPVKSARTQYRRIQYIGAVRRRHDDDSFIDGEAVHLDQQLIERLLSLVMTAAQTRAAPPSDSVDLVDEYDAGRVLLGIGEKVSHTRCTHTHEHFHEVRARYGKEGHLSLSGDRLGQQRLAGAGRSLQYHALGDPRAQSRVFARIAQEIHQLLKIPFFFLQTRHLREVDITRIGHARA